MYPSDVLRVQFDGTDGEFEIHFDSASQPNKIVVKESAGLPGNVKGGANEIVYEEDFSQPVEYNEIDHRS